MSTTIRRSARGAFALLMSAALVAVGLIAGSAPSAQAAPVVTQPGELVINGGGEQPVTVGWEGVLGRATHGSGGYPPSNIVDTNGLTGETYDGGTFLLTGVGASSKATQTIDLTPSSAAIDNGNVDALISAYVGGYTTQRDNAEVTYDFFDAEGTKLDSVVFGPVLPADRGNIAGFVPFAETVRIPSGTRSAVITITTQRFVAPANDAYVDNVSLILDAPSPTAIADSASTNQGVPVTVNAPVNDVPGTGAQIVPTSLRLLDGGIEVTSLTTSEGTYTVDSETGAVEFVPVEGFFGTTTPVPYRISDSSEQRTESTITIEVVFVAAPGLSVVKSATPSAPEDFIVGTEITYSFVVTNTGNVRIDDVTIAEDAFSGAGEVPDAECPAASIEPGGQMTCTASYTLVQEDIDNEGVNNTAIVWGTPVGQDTSVGSDPSTFEIPVSSAPAISVLKSAESVGATMAGDEVRYSFLVTNTGNVTVDTISIAESSFSGTGELPAASCSTASLLPGAFTTCTTEYLLTQADIDAGTVTNTAFAEAMFGDDPVLSGPSSVSLTIAGQPAIQFVKTTDSVVVTAAGQVVDYIFRISNTGNITVANVVINDTEFSGAGELSEIICPTSTIAPGTDLLCTASYTVVAADLTATAVSNSATAQADAGGTILESDVSTAVVTIDVSDPEVPSPEVPSPEVPGPEVPGPEVPSPEVPSPEVPSPEVPSPEVPGPEVPGPEVPNPEEPAPEIPVPGIPAPGDGGIRDPGVSGADRLPSTGAQAPWALVGGAALSLILGAVLFHFVGRRRVVGSGR